MNDEKVILNSGYAIDNKEHARVYEKIVKQEPYKVYGGKWDDISMSELFAYCYRDIIAYSPEIRTWYIYNGVKWKRDIEHLHVDGKLKDFVRLLELYVKDKLLVCKDEKEKDFLLGYNKKVEKLGDRGAREKIVRDCMVEFNTPITTFDKNPYLINVLNGTYNLETFTLQNHSPKDYITIQTDCNFKRVTDTTTFDRWYKFIDEITENNKELARYIQKCLGYSLLGINKEEIMFIAYGMKTRNGKGTLLNTIYSILGDYGNTTSVSFITHTNGSKNTTNVANPMLVALKPCRFLTMSEPDLKSKLDETLIKNYTGGDPIQTRQLYGEAFSFTPQFTMWISCNTLPDANDNSIFSSGRIKIIPFNKHFSETERDKNLKSLFLTKDAKKIIFNWLVDGYKLYVEEGLKEPQETIELTKTYEMDANFIELFLDEKTIKTTDTRIERTLLYREFKRWAKDNGIDVYSSQKFYNEIRKNYVEKKTIGLYYFTNIDWRDNKDA